MVIVEPVSGGRRPGGGRRGLDLLRLGAGSAAFPAAIKAREAGRSIALVRRGVGIVYFARGMPKDRAQIADGV